MTDFDQQLPTPDHSPSCSSPSTPHESIMPTPSELCCKLPLTSQGRALVASARRTVSNILSGSDSRVLAIVGPCSIHDTDAAIEYARALKTQATKLEDRVFVVMRTYCEKPRTQEGWKGLVRDPNLDNSEDVAKGIEVSRALMVQVTNEVGLPCGAELLDPIVSTYFSDVLAWGAIGARTSESQVHRDLACMLEGVPIGFKNGTAGDTTGAIDSIKAVKVPRSLLCIDPATGRVAVKSSPGSAMPHLVLRGGRNGPNYSKSDVVNAKTALKGLTRTTSRSESLLDPPTSEKPLLDAVLKKVAREEEEEGGSASPSSSNGPRVLIDCSHGNSMKDYRRQQAVATDVARRIHLNEPSDGAFIAGIMLESNLCAGNQIFDPSSSSAPSSCQPGERSTPLQRLKRGVSITDSCVDLETTWAILQELYEQAATRFWSE